MASLDDKQLNGSNPPLRVTLYTNHLCPYAHRAHIALKELGLPYDEVTIDLNRPREPWYLKINPKGLVPSIKISNAQVQDVVLTESTVITQFLADMAPSHLLPVAESSLQAALVRARINFFIDTWNTKLTPFTVAVSRMEDPLAKKAKCEEWSRTVEKEIEPLLGDADPFFGGSKELTLAEVQLAPFLIRWYAMSNDYFLPKNFKKSLEALPHFSRWARAVMARKSVLDIWDEDWILQKMKERFEKAKMEKE